MDEALKGQDVFGDQSHYFSYGDVAQSRRTQPQSFSVDEGTESCPDTDAQSCHGQVIVVRIDTLDKVDSEQESCIEVGVLFG